MSRKETEVIWKTNGNTIGLRIGKIVHILTVEEATKVADACEFAIAEVLGVDYIPVRVTKEDMEDWNDE